MTVLNSLTGGRALAVAVLASLIGVSASAAPTVNSFSPAFGSSSDPSPVIISGTGFFPGTVVVKFNGVQSAVAGAVDANTIQAAVPGGAPIGSGPIYVSVGGVSTLSQTDFTVIGAGPYISGFTPNSGAPGGDITITGAHFTANMTVRFNGVATVTNAADPNSFVVKVPPGATSGFISVSNSLGIWTSTNIFSVLPIITGFSPTNGRAGTNVIITGTNFLGTTSIQFSNVTATSFTVQNNNSIQVTVPTGALRGLIRVSAPGGTAFSTNGFRIPATVTGFSPTFGKVGSSITVTGANFNAGSPVVFFGGNAVAAAPTGVTFSQLTAVVPPGAITGPITVSNIDGSGISPNLFYLPPVITGFTPTNSPPGSNITISGVNFIDASAVSFNGTPAAGFTVLNNSNITATVPFGFTTGPLSVTAPGGTTNSTSIPASNFYAAPIISSFSPSHGLPGTNVTIFGSSFLGTLAVKFSAAGGGTTNGAIVSVANGQIVVRVPTNAITGPLAVIAPAGTNTSVSSFILDYADLLVTVTDDPDPVTIGSNLVYTVLIKNFGPFPAPVTLTNVLPPSITFVSASAGTTVSNVTTADLGNIAVNNTVFVTITGTPTLSGLITNRTTVMTGPIATIVNTPTTVEGLPPTLVVNFNPPNAIVLSWPTASSNFTLQFNPNPATTNWQNVLTVPTSSGGTNTITQTNLGTGMFYRLKK